MYPTAYLEYLVNFHANRDYFECHEILEEYWKEQPPAKREKVWVGLIQIAVSLYHQRRSNFTGAVKTMRGAIRILSREKERLAGLGLDADVLIQLLEHRLKQQEANADYTSIDLPIADDTLLKQCINLSEQKGLTWGRPSDMTDHYLLNKHKLRDRSDVIAERQRQLDRSSGLE